MLCHAMMKHMKLGALAKILHLAVLTAAGFLESRSSIVAGGGSLVSFKEKWTPKFGQ